jgi:hypothetical protein
MCSIQGFFPKNTAIYWVVAIPACILAAFQGKKGQKKGFLADSFLSKKMIGY